jgi:hypothetical protein
MYRSWKHEHCSLWSCMLWHHTVLQVSFWMNVSPASSWFNTEDYGNMSSETFVSTYKTMCHHNPEDDDRHLHDHKNHRPHQEEYSVVFKFWQLLNWVTTGITTGWKYDSTLNNMTYIPCLASMSCTVNCFQVVSGLINFLGHYIFSQLGGSKWSAKW